MFTGEETHSARAAEQQVAADEAGASDGASPLNLVFGGQECERTSMGEPMSVQGLAFLAVRLLSLWLIVWSFVNLAGFAADWPSEPMGSLLRVSILSLTILPFASALVLWAFSDSLAKYLARGVPDGPAVTSVDPSMLHTVGVSLLGLWLVVNVLPELVQVSSLYLGMRFARPPELPYDEATEYKVWTYAQAGSARFASLLARFVIGGTLFLGPKRVANSTLGGIRRFFGPVRPEPTGE